MRVVTLRGRVSFWKHFVRGSVVIIFLRDVARILYILFFSFFIRYIVLVHEVLWPSIDIHCTYFLLYIVDVFFSFTYPFMCCFFSFFYTHASYLFVCNLLFCFTQRCLDEFCLKCFRNTSCQSLLVINSLLAKFFKSLC